MAKITRSVRCTFLAVVGVVIFVSTSYADDSSGSLHYNWNGLYFGADVGHGWGREGTPNMTFDDGSDIGVADYFARGGNIIPKVRQRGGIAGLRLGYNWMLNPVLVAGLVTDIQNSWMNDARTNTKKLCIECPTISQSNSVRTDWFGTLRGKLGVAHNNWLFYATSGLAYGRVESSGALSLANIYGNQIYGTAYNFAGSVSKTKTGWVTGVGIDYGLTSNWTLGVEYLYVDLGNVSYTETSTNGNAPLTTFTVKNNVSADILSANLNYKF